MKESVRGLGLGLCTLHTTTLLPAPEGGQQEFELWPKNRQGGQYCPSPNSGFPDLVSRHWHWLRKAQARVGGEAGRGQPCARSVGAAFPGRQRLGETPTETRMVSVLLVLTVTPGSSLFYKWASGRLGGEAQCTHGLTMLLQVLPEQHSFMSPQNANVLKENYFQTKKDDGKVSLGF